MPSIDDVFAELQGINARLNTLHADNVALQNGQTQVRNAVDANVAATQSVQTAINQATQVLKQIAQNQMVGNEILFHLTEQTDAMLCSLEQIARNTCGIHTEAHRQTGLQRRIAAADEGVLDIAKSTHPGAALDLDRRTEMRADVERCCPPPVDQLACEFRPCPRPKELDPKMLRHKKEE